MSRLGDEFEAQACMGEIRITSAVGAVFVGRVRHAPQVRYRTDPAGAKGDYAGMLLKPRQDVRASALENCHAGSA
jgi:hypothetical protein